MCGFTWGRPSMPNNGVALGRVSGMGSVGRDGLVDKVDSNRWKEDGWTVGPDTCCPDSATTWPGFRVG